ncbi:MAG: hypothetical protein KDN20_14115 [Verrucomicrobiae bacterium]|nr:hypothetical protein [Verrucomicrobiae bacterium]
MTLESLKQSVESDSAPPDDLSDALRALWCARKGRWEEAHNIAQDMPSAMGSWIHAHLHLVEGDLGNAGYWYHRAGKPVGSPDRIDEDWEMIAAAAIGEA